MVQPIPKPQLLDAHRPIHQDRGDTAEHALSESCGYANMLWDQLDTLRSYLLASLPPDPHAPGPVTQTSTSPTGPGDEEGWQQWMRTFADVTSVLCGPHGDSGFGLSRAREEAQRRRTFPAAAATRSSNTDSTPSAATAESANTSPPMPQSKAAPESTAPWSRDTAAQDQPRDRGHLARAAGLAVLIGLALRGLRPRHSRPGGGGRPSTD